MQTPPTTPTHQYSTPQSLIDSYSGRADGPRAPNANSPPLHLKDHEPRKLVVLEARAVERERDAARQRQSQRDAVFRHRRRRVGRDPEHLDPEPRRGLDVDAVEPRAPQRDQADALLLQLCQRGGVGAVVHKRDGDVAPGSQRRGRLVEAGGDEAGVREEGVEGGGEEVPDVGLGAEDGDARRRGGGGGGGGSGGVVVARLCSRGDASRAERPCISIFCEASRPSFRRRARQTMSPQRQSARARHLSRSSKPDWCLRGLASRVQ